MEYFEDINFEHKRFDLEALPAGEYEDCNFSHCVFSKANLSNYRFSNCIFDTCDLSMAIITGTLLRDVQFKDCKMLGLRFDECSNFIISMNFENCTLNFSSFFQLKLKKIKFNNCSLQEVDFVETNLTGASFDNSNLQRAVFARSILEQADFRTATNFSIDPENNKMTKAKFSNQNIAGLLDKYNLSIK